jgi:hypothetical protein
MDVGPIDDFNITFVLIFAFALFYLLLTILLIPFQNTLAKMFKKLRMNCKCIKNAIVKSGY